MGHHRLPPEMDLAVRSFIRRHKRAIKLSLLAAALMLPIIAIGLIWVLIWGAGQLKDFVASKSLPGIPVQIEQRIGDAAFAQLKLQTRFVAEPQVLDPLNQLAKPLIDRISDSSRRFNLFVSDSMEVNACALPGGYIVFNQGLLRRARTAEEIQGVLAHEMAHIIERHGVIQLAQSMGVSLAVGALVGNETGYVDALVREGSTLLTLKFSRDHERAADDRAWELLRGAQVNPKGMVDFFVTLAKEAGAGRQSSLLSTHPAPQERVDRLQQKITSLDVIERKSFTAEFEALQLGLRRLTQSGR